MKRILFYTIAFLFVLLPEANAQNANAQKYYQSAQQFYKEKKYEQALLDLDEAISIQGDYVAAYQLRASVLYNLKNYEEAILDYSYVIASNPDKNVHYYNRGNAYYALKIYDSAFFDYEESIRLNPKHDLSYVGCGNIRAHFQQYEDAIKDYNIAIDLKPENMFAYYYRGITYKFMGEYQKANDDLAYAVQLDTKRANSTYVLAVIEPLAHLGKFEEVAQVMEYFRAEYKTGYIDNKNKIHFKKYVQAITDHMTKSDYAGALRLLNEAEASYVGENGKVEATTYNQLNYSSILTLKGYVLQKLNNDEQAKQAYDQSLTINPNQPEVNQALKDIQYKAAMVVQQDQVDPVIKIIEPSQNTRAIGVDDDVVANTKQRIRGQAIDPGGIKSVRLNNKLLKIEENGYFDTVVTITQGVNVFTITATDKAANSATQTIQINTVKEDSRGPKMATAPNPLNYDPVYHAILIAESEYNDRNIASLKGPVKDMRKIFNVLRNQYNFSEANTDTLVNASKTTILETIINKANSLGENDNLVIFYAGHGELIKQPDNSEEGFLVPVDARKGSLSSYISSDDLMRTIKYSKSRHILFVADACFAGSLFRDMQKEAPTPVVDAYKDKSRKLLASGNRTAVPDDSEFIEYFRLALQENKEKYITAEQLIDTFKNQYRTTTRLSLQYFPIKNVEDFGGQFVFKRK